MMIYVSHLLKDEQMRELVRETDMGIECIEFSIAENLDRFEEKMEKYKMRLEYMGCRRVNIHGPFLDLNPMTYDAKILEVTKRRYEEAYRAAQILNADKIIYHTCYVPGVYLLIGWAERVAEFYKEFLENKSGIQVLVENVFDRDPMPILEVIERVGHPDFGFCLDIGHANCYSPVKPEEWAKIFGSHIKHIHMHDNIGDRDAHLGLGKGNIPAADILNIVRKNNPQVTCTIECSRKNDVIDSWKVLTGQKSIGSDFSLEV